MGKKARQLAKALEAAKHAECAGGARGHLACDDRPLQTKFLEKATVGSAGHTATMDCLIRQAALSLKYCSPFISLL